MDEQLSLLVQLQEIDAAHSALAEKRKRLPQLLADIDRRRETSKSDLVSVKEALQTAQKNKRDRDADLEAGGQKVEKLKARTSEIKNNKEYQALLKEIETAEKENKAIEDDILVLMEKIDAAVAAITAAEQRFKTEEASLQDEQKQHEADFARLGEELQGVEQARKELEARIDETILGQYKRLLGSKGGIALAEARGESCSGCYMSIPPQVFVNVKKNESIITCPHCGRILYYKDAIVPRNP